MTRARTNHKIYINFAAEKAENSEKWLLNQTSLLPSFGVMFSDQKIPTPIKLNL